MILKKIEAHLPQLLQKTQAPLFQSSLKEFSSKVFAKQLFLREFKMTLYVIRSDTCMFYTNLRLTPKRQMSKKGTNYFNRNSYYSNYSIVYKISCHNLHRNRSLSQPAITCSKLTIETLEQDVKYVQS